MKHVIRRKKNVFFIITSFFLSSSSVQIFCLRQQAKGETPIEKRAHRRPNDRNYHKPNFKLKLYSNIHIHIHGKCCQLYTICTLIHTVPQSLCPAKISWAQGVPRNLFPVPGCFVFKQVFIGLTNVRQILIYSVSRAHQKKSTPFYYC